MSYTIKNINIASSDNIHSLSGIIYIPDEQIKGILHIVHGMCEYIDRYSHVMDFFCKEGYICCGFDNLGHGKTVNNKNELGYISKRNGWKYLIRDVYLFSAFIKKNYPGNKYILMGHSMGSFISRLVVENYPETASKLIICGTGDSNAATPFGLLLTSIVKIVHGDKFRSSIINKMVFFAFNRRFEGNSDYDWISNDKTIVEKSEKDLLCNFEFTISGMHDLVKLQILCNRREWYRKISNNLPILLISGKEDPVGNFGKGVKHIYKRIKSSGNSNVSIILYKKCRHEVHNDICKNQEFKDILQFINEQ